MPRAKVNKYRVRYDRQDDGTDVGIAKNHKREELRITIDYSKSTYRIFNKVTKNVVEMEVKHRCKTERSLKDKMREAVRTRLKRLIKGFGTEVRQEKGVKNE